MGSAMTPSSASPAGELPTFSPYFGFEQCAPPHPPGLSCAPSLTSASSAEAKLERECSHEPCFKRSAISCQYGSGSQTQIGSL
jgi:hypothetical protein